ncbi:RNA polymerase sigma factor [Chloroflexota bacterium]
MQNINDAELINRARNRRNDPTAGAAAIGELYDRYHESIFRYIWSRVSDQQLAEDLTGDVFTRMVTHLPKYRNTGVPFQAWLFRIARNLVIDSHRKVSARKELPLESVINKSTGEHDPAQIVEEQIFIEQILSVLQVLKPIKQDVITLRFIVGLSLQEVAKVLGKTTGSIKITQHRALKELRTNLESKIGEEK